MKILVACEESQAVCIAFRNKGHKAYSCDIQECSGGHPEWHIVNDVIKIIEGGYFNTQNGDLHQVWEWDLMIAHPPCTYLSYVGNSWFNIDKYGIKSRERHKQRIKALEFFCSLWWCNIPKICIENPRGYVANYIKPTQLIHPYYYGDSATKATLLWLKNLPPLMHSKTDSLFEAKTHVYKGEMRKDGSGSLSHHGNEIWSLPDAERKKIRSKTFPGIAQAMADQWG